MDFSYTLVFIDTALHTGFGIAIKSWIVT